MNITIFGKIKINMILILILLISSYAGFILEMAMILFSIILHEIGHILMIRCFRGKIKKLNVGIFGGCIEVDTKNINSKFSKLLINIAGSSS